jgi:hypothetical protein
MKYLTSVGLLAAALSCSPACADNWFAVAKPGTASADTQVEVNLDTVRARGAVSEGVIRVSYKTPRTHPRGFGYQSFVATAQFDCSRHVVALASAAYFSLAGGHGNRVGVDSSGREEGMSPGLLESVPVPTRQALLRATCATPQTPAN